MDRGRLLSWETDQHGRYVKLRGLGPSRGQRVLITKSLHLFLRIYPRVRGVLVGTHVHTDEGSP